VKLPRHGIRYVQRYREIIQILVKYGLGGVIEQLELLPAFDLPRRFLRSIRPRPDLPLGYPQRMRLAIEELGPTFIKLAQVLSTRPDLIPPAYIAELSKLQDTVPPVPWEPILTQIEAELGASVKEVFAELEVESVAAASLAQVHRATLRSGDQVVVKVQRPDIETIIEIDLDILFDLARFLQTRTPLGQIYDFPGIAEDFAYTLRAEMDYRQEGRNADRFRRNFAGETYLYIPQVHWDYTTQRVIVFERIAGIKIDDVEALDAAGLDRHQIALHSAQIIVKEVLIDGFFHADPHPGNFFVMTDKAGGPVIGAMDFGMVGHLTPRVKEDLVRLFIVAAQLDAESIVEQLVRMSAAQRGVDRPGLQRDLERLLIRYYGRPLKEIRAREVVEEIMPIAFRHHLHLPSDLWLLGKTLGMMEGVGLKLDPDFDVFAVSQPYVRRFIRQMASPRAWGKKLLKGASEWGNLLLQLPDRIPRLLDQVSEGELEIGLRLRGRDVILRHLDRAANRLAVSMLVAALIIGLALVVVSQGEGSWLAQASFATAALLGLWLLISIWRSGRS